MTQLPTITRQALTNGKHRYEQDGEVHTAQSGRVYTHASAYRNAEGKVITFLHQRADLAVKGSSDANRIVGAGAWTRLPGIITITEAA